MRERNKLAVREAIGEAALRLALDQGPDGLVLVRVADIASAAGVAPRTYNNYFSSLPEAICSFQADRARLVGDALRARPSSEPLPRAITAAVVEVFAEPEPDRAGLALILRTPALAGEALKAFALAEEPLTEAIAERCDGKLRAQVLAAGVAAAVRVAGRHWLDTTDPPPFAEVLRAALAHLLPGEDLR
ncbi:TetR/AcrR family transcriptional regulator [Actinoplanes sp. NPDC051513]|uniref:TetR/AcrR family transcriptional regulator n=1 Tax=Actinoplanes sp. NPDC051513 TaxID=3363908 RepID=UPI00378BB4A1